MLRNVLLVLVSILAGVVVSEALVRSIAPQTLPESDLYLIDSQIGKRMRPHWTGQEFGVAVRTNSFGLRGPETSFAKPAGRYRILALGDSWTFGFRVAEGDTYPRQLERILNERSVSRGQAPRYEVINAGVTGYSTGQEAQYFGVEGHRFSPDLVLVAYYPVNDTDTKREKYARYNRLRSIHPWALELYLLPKELRVFQYLRGWKRALKDHWERVDNDRFGSAEAAGGGLGAFAAQLMASHWSDSYREGDAGWEGAKDALREIGEVTRKIGARGLVILLPDLEDLQLYIERDHPRIEALVRAAVRDAKLDYYDLLTSFLPYRDRPHEVRARGYRHPNAEGYGVIAEALAARIERRYLGVGAGAHGALGDAGWWR